MEQKENKDRKKGVAAVAWWDLVGMLINGQYWRALLTSNAFLLPASWAVHFLG
jgi:hypothetical protein